MFAKCIAINYTFSRILQGLVKGRKKKLHISRYGAFSIGKHGFCYTKTRPLAAACIGALPP